MQKLKIQNRKRRV